MQPKSVIHALSVGLLLLWAAPAAAYDLRQGNLSCIDCHEEATAGDAQGDLEAAAAAPRALSFALAAAVPSAWSGGENLSNTAAGSGLCSSTGKALAVDGKGNLHAVWHDKESGSWEVYYAVRPAGGNWSLPERLTSADGRTSAYPAVAADSVGRVFVVWEDYVYTAGFLPKPEVFLREWDGAGWSGIRIVSNTEPGTDASWYPAIAVGSDDRVTVLWQDRRLGATYAVFRGDEDGEVGLVAADGVRPSVGAGGGRVLAAWETSGGAIVGQELETGSPQTLAASGAFASVHVNAAGTGYAAWNTPDWSMGYAGFENGAWGSPGQASFAAAYYPSVAVDAQGNPHVAFGYGSVSHASASGGTWGDPEAVQSSSAYLPILTAGPNALHLAYVDTSEGNSEIHYRTKPIEMRNPVLYIPGLMTTKLYEGNDLRWASIWDFIGDIGDDFLDPMELQREEDGTPIRDTVQPRTNDPLDDGKVEDWEPHLMMPKEHLLFGKRFQETFYDTLQAAGYTPHMGQNLGNFTFFPYDWRWAPSNEPVVQAALKTRVQTLRSANGGARIDVVAHSLGGLVVKPYIEGHPNEIRRVILIGTPHLGAAKAFRAVQFGQMELGFWSSLVTSENQFMKISQNWPVPYALSPGADFHNRAGYGPSFEEINVDLDGDGVMSVWDRDKIQAWYHDGICYRNWYTDPGPELDPVYRHNGTMADAGTTFHNDWDSLGKWANHAEKVYLIAGQQEFTAETIRLALWDPDDSTWPEAWQLSARGVSGDGTVPTRSASLDFDDSVDNVQRFYVRGVEHQELLDDPGVANLVTWILRGELDQHQLPDHIQDHPFPDTLSLWEIIFHSPVEVHVYDADGHHLGPVGPKLIDRGIPGGRYHRNPAPDGYLTTIHLPLEGAYRIEILSLGEGSFRMAVRTIEDSTVTHTSIYDRVPLQTETTGSVELTDPNTFPNISLDLNGDGQEDQSFPPNVILAGDERDDRTPPTTSLALSGTQGQSNYYVSGVIVSLTAQDDPGGAGVRGTKYSLDGGAVWTSYQAPLVLDEGCQIDVGYRSQDYNHNLEEANITPLKIDLEPPMIASFTVTPDVLWPPNHKLVEVVPSVAVTDNCTAQPVEWVIESIRRNEGDLENTYDPLYDQDTAEGGTEGDMQVIDGRIYLRAERAGKSDGRTYTLTLRAADEAGNVSRATASVIVPHDQR